MWLFLRSLFCFAGAGERRAQVQARMKAQALAANELSRAARGQNYALERMLRETQALERDEQMRDGVH